MKDIFDEGFAEERGYPPDANAEASVGSTGEADEHEYGGIDRDADNEVDSERSISCDAMSEGSGCLDIHNLPYSPVLVHKGAMQPDFNAHQNQTNRAANTVPENQPSDKLASLPQTVQASARMALADIRTSEVLRLSNLEIAFHQAADAGALSRFVAMFNHELQTMGKNYKIVSAQSGTDGTLSFDLIIANQQTNTVIATFKGILLRAPKESVDVAKPHVDLYDPKQIRLAEERLDKDLKIGKRSAHEARMQLSMFKRLRQVAHFSSPGSVDVLVQQAKEGNRFSRNALTAILVPKQSHSAWQFLTRHSEHHFRKTPLPEIKIDDRTEEIKLRAIAGLRQLIAEPGLSRAETSALALCLAEAYRNKQTKIVSAVKELFALTCEKSAGNNVKQRDLERDYATRVESILDGLVDILTSDRLHLPESSRTELALVYAKAADSPNNRVVCHAGERGAGARMFDIGRNIKSHLAEFTLRATKGDAAALEILAAFAGGVAKHNSAINMFFIPHGKSQPEPGDFLAKECSDFLVDWSSKHVSNRALLLKILLSKQQNEVLKDHAKKLETLGLIASQNQSNIPMEARQILRAGLADTARARSALSGLLAIGPALEPEDLHAIKDNLHPEIISILHSTAGVLPAKTAQALAEIMAVRIIDRDKKFSIDQRIQAIDAIAALGKHQCTHAVIRALQSFIGDLGRNNLTEELKLRKYDFSTATEVETATSKLQRSATLALLNIAESNKDRHVKSEAFSALAARNLEGFSLDERVEFERRFIRLMENNPGDVAIRHAVTKLVYNIPKDILNPDTTDGKYELTSISRIAAGFKNAGVDAPDEIVTYFARKAMQIHGQAEVEQVLSRLALFNGLPPQLRESLTARTELAEGQSLNLAGRSLSHRIINSLPEGLRKKLTGSSEQIPPGQWKGGKNAIIDVQEFRKLPVELRKSVTASADKIDAPLVMGLLANGGLANTSSSAHILLAKPSLEQQVERLKKTSEARVEEERRALVALQRCKAEVLAGLQRHAKDGVGWLNKLAADREMRFAILILVQAAAGAVFIGDYSDEKWNFVQRKFALKELRFIEILKTHLEPAIARQTRRLQKASGEQSELELALANKKYFELVYQGNTHDADKYAVDAFSRFGRQVFSAPDIARSLSLTGEGIYANCMQRLHSQRETALPGLVLNPLMGSEKRKNAATPSDGLLAGMELLELIHSKGNKKDFIDTAAIKVEALLSIDNDPDLKRVNSIADQISQKLVVLNAEVAIIKANHDRFSGLIKDAGTRAREVNSLLNRLTSDELCRLHATRDLLAKSLANVSRDDAKLRKELAARIQALDAALMLLDPAYKHEDLQTDKMKQIARIQKEYDFLKRQSWNWADLPIPREELRRFILDHPGWELTKLQRQYWAERTDSLAEQLMSLRGSLYQRKNLKKLLTYLDSPEAKNESTFRTWLKTDGAELLVSLAAAATATAIVVATFSNPVTGAMAILGSEALGGLALAATGTLGATLGREGTKEMLLAMGVTSHGSLAGDTMRGAKKEMQDGSEQQLTLLNDAIPAYLAEFAVGTSVGWAGTALGQQIGSGLRLLGGRAAGVFAAENGPVAAQLSRNIAAVEAAATPTSWFGRFANSVLIEARTTAALTPTSIVLEQGINASGRHYGYKLSEGNIFTSFLAATALSVPFGAMHPQVVHTSAAARTGAPLLVLKYRASLHQAHSYRLEASERGSLFRLKENGTFLEFTKNGLAIEWRKSSSKLRCDAPVIIRREKFPFDIVAGQIESGRNRSPSVDASQKFGKKFDAFFGRPGVTQIPPDMLWIADLRAQQIQAIKDILSASGIGRAARPPAERASRQTKEKSTRLDSSRESHYERFNVDPERLSKINQRLDELLKPVTELERQIGDLEQEYFRLPRDKSAIEESAKLRQKLIALAERSDAVRAVLLQNEEFRRLNIVRCLAAGEFPPGEHLVRLQDGNTVKLLIGETVLVKQDGSVQRALLGGSVPEAHVREILTQLEQSQLLPDQVAICSLQSSLHGAVNKAGSTYQIWINARGERHPSFTRMTFNHETGHLFEYVKWRKSAPAAVHEAVQTAYLKGLEGDLASTAQQFLKEKLNRQSFVEALKAYPDTVIKDMKTIEDHMRYLCSRAEVFAEMHMLYLEQQRIKAHTGRNLSYQDLIEHCTKPVDQRRAAIMKHFEQMFEVLSKQVFPHIKPEKNRTVRGDWKAAPRALDKHGPTD